MARKKGTGRAGGKRTGAARPPVKRKAARLPTGSYSWRGRAVPFSKLPKTEQARFRAVWSRKAAKTRAKTEPIKAPARAPKADSKTKRAAREWVSRRSARVDPTGRYASPDQISGTLPPTAILAARELQREAHAAWVKQKKHGGGRALEVANLIRESLGEELAALMPQLWWYH